MKSAIFIWVPKTGGSSLVSAFHITKMKRLDLLDWDKLIGVVTFGHMDCNLLLSKRILPRVYFDGAHKFMFVRNPYDRAVSLYFRVHYPYESFEQCLERILAEDPKPGLFNIQGLSICSPQVRWLCDGVRIFKFEDYAAETVRLAQFLGLRRPIVVGNVNPTNQPKPPLTERAQHLIETIYRDDFKMFGYQRLK